MPNDWNGMNGLTGLASANGGGDNVEEDASETSGEENVHGMNNSSSNIVGGGARLNGTELERLLRLRAERVQRTPKCARVKTE